MSKLKLKIRQKRWTGIIVFGPWHSHSSILQGHKVSRAESFGRPKLRGLYFEIFTFWRKFTEKTFANFQKSSFLIAIAFVNGQRKWIKENFKAGGGSRDIPEILSGRKKKRNSKKNVLLSNKSLKQYCPFVCLYLRSTFTFFDCFRLFKAFWENFIFSRKWIL